MKENDAARSASEVREYRRMPLPKSAQQRMALVIPLWMLLIFSPFVAFAVNGRVDDSNWTPAFLTAGLCLAALMALSFQRARAWRLLPQAIRDEYRFGRLLPPLAGRRFRERDCGYAIVKKGRRVVEFTTDAVLFAPGVVTGSSFYLEDDKTIAAAQAGIAGVAVHRIVWKEIEEWQVHDNHDDPDYYRLILTRDRHVDLHRPCDASADRDALDYVRAVGRRPVRLFCDIW